MRSLRGCEKRRTYFCLRGGEIVEIPVELPEGPLGMRYAPVSSTYIPTRQGQLVIWSECGEASHLAMIAVPGTIFCAHWYRFSVGSLASVEAPAAWLPVAVLAPRVGRAVSPGLSGVGDGRGHVLMVSVLTVDMFMVGGLTVDVFMVGMLMVGVLTVGRLTVGGLMVGGLTVGGLVVGGLMVCGLMVGGLMVGGLMAGVGGGKRRSGTAVSTGSCVVDGELLKTSVL